MVPAVVQEVTPNQNQLALGMSGYHVLLEAWAQFSRPAQPNRHGHGQCWLCNVPSKRGQSTAAPI